ncbi:hypothetical protein T484DRAFT_1867189, partial [Baffinella frigidus]
RLSDTRRTDLPSGGLSTASTSPPSPAPTDAAGDRTPHSPDFPPPSPLDDTALNNLLDKRKTREDHRKDANNEAATFALLLNTTLQNTIAAAVVSSSCPAFVTQGQSLAEDVKTSFEKTADAVEALSQQSFDAHQRSLSDAESRISALARDLVAFGIDLDNISPPSNRPFNVNAQSAHHVCPFCCVRTAIIDQNSDSGPRNGPNKARWERHLAVCPNFPGGIVPRSHEPTTDLAAPQQLHSKRARREADPEAQALLRSLEESERALTDIIDDQYGSILMLHTHNYSNAHSVVRKAVDAVVRAQQAHERVEFRTATSGAALCRASSHGTDGGSFTTAPQALLYMLYVNPRGLTRKDMQRQASNLALQEDTTAIAGRIEGLLRNGWAQLQGPGTFTMIPMARSYFETEGPHSSREALESALRAGSIALAYRNTVKASAAQPKHPASSIMPPPAGPPPPRSPAEATSSHSVYCNPCRKMVRTTEPTSTWVHNPRDCRLERVKAAILQAVATDHANTSTELHSRGADELRVITADMLNEEETLTIPEFTSALRSLITSGHVPRHDSPHDMRPVHPPRDPRDLGHQLRNREPRADGRSNHPAAPASPDTKRHPPPPAPSRSPRVDTADSLHTQHLQALIRGEESISIRMRVLRIIYCITDADARGAAIEEIIAGLTPSVNHSVIIDTVADLKAQGILRDLPHLRQPAGCPPSTETRYLILGGYNHRDDPSGNLGAPSPAQLAAPRGAPVRPRPTPLAPPPSRTHPVVSRQASSVVSRLPPAAAPSQLQVPTAAIQQHLLDIVRQHRQDGPYGCTRQELFPKVYAALINNPIRGYILNVHHVIEQCDILIRDYRLRHWRTPDGTRMYGLAPYGGVGCPPLPRATTSPHGRITDGELALALHQIVEETFDSPRHNNVGLAASTILQQARNLVGQHAGNDDLERVLLHALDDQSLCNLPDGDNPLVRYAPFGAQPGDGPNQRLRGTRGEEHVGMIQADQGGTGWKRQCATCDRSITWSRIGDSAAQFACHILQSTGHLEGQFPANGLQPPAGPARIANAVFTAISSLTDDTVQATQADLTNATLHARAALGYVHYNGVETAIALLLDEPTIVKATIHEGRQLYAPTPSPDAEDEAGHTLTEADPSPL